MKNFWKKRKTLLADEIFVYFLKDISKKTINDAF